MDEVAGFDKADYPLRPVACDIWDGHIFINLSDASAAAGGSDSATCRDRFAPWRMQDLRLVHRDRVRRRAPTGSWWCRTTTSACTAR